MNIIIGGRQSGKTTKLVLRSAYEDIPIMVSNKSRINELLYMAKQLHLEIPTPWTVEEYLYMNKFRGNRMFEAGILIDEAEDVLQRFLAGIPILEATINDRGNISYLRTRDIFNESED